MDSLTVAFDALVLILIGLVVFVTLRAARRRWVVERAKHSVVAEIAVGIGILIFVIVAALAVYWTVELGGI